MLRSSLNVLHVCCRLHLKQSIRKLPRAGRLSKILTSKVNDNSDNFANEYREHFLEDSEKLEHSRFSDVAQEKKPTDHVFTKETLQDQEIFLSDDVPIKDFQEQSVFDGAKRSPKIPTSSSSEFNAPSTSTKMWSDSLSTKHTYRSMILNLVTANRKVFQEKPHLLTDGLFAATSAFYIAEFSDFFRFWKAEFLANLAQFDVESLCKVIEHLGFINLKTNGSLRRHLNCEQLNSILVHVAKHEKFSRLNSRSIISLYNGLSSLRLAQQSAVTNVSEKTASDYPPKELISGTASWVEKSSKDDAQIYDICLACCTIVYNLSTFEFRPDLNDSDSSKFLPSLLPVCQAMFELNANLTEKMAQSINFPSVLTSQIHFGQGYAWFVENGILEPDQNLVRYWLQSAKNFFTIRLSGELSDKMFDDRAEYDTPKHTVGESASSRKISTLMVDLCAVTLDLVYKTNSFGDFPNLKSLWCQVLVKDIAQHSRKALNNLLVALRIAETNLDFRKILETQNDENDMVSAEIWEAAMSRLEQYNTQSATSRFENVFDKRQRSSKDVSHFDARFDSAVGKKLTSEGGGSRALKEISRNLRQPVDVDNAEGNFDSESSEREHRRPPPSSARNFVPPDVDEFLASQQVQARKKVLNNEKDLESKLTSMHHRDLAASRKEISNKSRRRSMDDDEGDERSHRRSLNENEGVERPSFDRSRFRDNTRFASNSRRRPAYNNDDDDADYRSNEDRVRGRRRSVSPSRYGGDDDGYEERRSSSSGYYDTQDSRGGRRSGRVHLKKRDGAFKDERWRFQDNDDYDTPEPRGHQRYEDAYDPTDFGRSGRPSFRAKSDAYDATDVGRSGRPTFRDNDDAEDNDEQYSRGNRRRRR